MSSPASYELCRDFYDLLNYFYHQFKNRENPNKFEYIFSNPRWTLAHVFIHNHNLQLWNKSKVQRKEILSWFVYYLWNSWKCICKEKLSIVNKQFELKKKLNERIYPFINNLVEREKIVWKGIKRKTLASLVDVL